MSKADFISGTVFEFKIAVEHYYAYCKVLDFRNIREFDGVLVKVYSHIVRQPITNIDVLRDKDWLFGARRMPWIPAARGKGAWKIKGVLIAADDYLIPDFKYCIKSSPFVEDESMLSPWDVVRNINEYSPCEYKSIAHLEDTVVSPRPAIEIRTAMEYCRQHDLNIEKYFDLTETLNNLIYRQMIKVPIYQSIAKDNRGKAIT